MDYLRKDVDPDIKLVDEKLTDEKQADEKSDGYLTSRLVQVTGRVKSFEKAFKVRIEEARLASGETVLLRTGEISIPKRLEGIVLGVFGLDTRPIGTRGPATGYAKLMSAEIDPATLPTPPKIAKRYKFPEPAGMAKGQVIALMQFGGGYDPEHPKKYFNDLGVKQPTLVNVKVLGADNTTGSKYDKEVTLDIEVAGSVAEEATIVTYFAPHTEAGWIAAIEKAVLDGTNRPYIMSISWGAPELGTSNTLTWTKNGMDAMSVNFLKAAAIDMTVLAACGDDGSDCRVGDWKAHVPYPASDPYVIACGGTTIKDFAGEPNKEIAWERGGGGISDVYTVVPAYQDEDELPMSRNTMGKGRGVPDISGYADPGYAFWVGETMVLAGTSLVAPLYAAAIARLNVKNGALTGYCHPALYTSSALRRDIDDPVSNSNSNGLNGAPGYYGRDGWDGRTGLGVWGKPGV